MSSKVVLTLDLEKLGQRMDEFGREHEYSVINGIYEARRWWPAGDARTNSVRRAT